MSAILILIRHGEAEHHSGAVTGGWTDSALTERGKKQAEAIGNSLIKLCANGTTTFLSSDLLRAKSTAEIIASHIGLQPTLHAELRELNNGLAKDKTTAEANRIELPRTAPAVDWVPYPGAESWRLMTERVTHFVNQIVASVQTDRLIIVSHGNALIAIVHWWLQLAEHYWSSVSYRFDAGSISELSVNPWGERLIVRLNDTAHLRFEEAQTTSSR